MKILIAPFAYKGTISPPRLTRAIALGVKKAKPGAHLILLPLADGGDGTIESLHYTLGGVLEETSVTDHLNDTVKAAWLRLPYAAVLEMALMSGLALYKGRTREPLNAHSKGLGELIRYCGDEGYSNLIVALGGSASTDGGTGALSALGAKFLNANGLPLKLGGGALVDLHAIDLSGLMKFDSLLTLTLALDVQSPLLGPHGAAHVFAPQKGASPQDVTLLEAGLKRLADVLEPLIGRRLRDIPGTGAAGGTAFGLTAGLNATFNSGFHLIAQMIELQEKIEDSDLVISAEGRLDEQSLLGKGVGQLAKMCQEQNKPLWLIPASASADVDWSSYGIERLLSSASADSTASECDVISVAESIFYAWDWVG